MKENITPIGWYKWYPRDFISSSTVRRMSYLAQGIYRALLDLQWEDGSVPTSMDEVAQILRLNEHEQSEFEPYLSSCFPDGANPKLAEERAKSVAYVIQQKEYGKRGGATGGKGRPVIVEPEPEPEPKPKARARAVATKFAPPSLKEVREYMSERNWKLPISGATKFCNYYDQRDWKVGKHPMKDWKRAVITWESNMTDADFVKATPKATPKVVEGEVEGIHYQVLPDGTRVAM